MDSGDCVFCKIVNGELPSFKIYETKNYLAFLDIAQFVKGHTVIIPKKHYRFVWDIEDYEGFMKFTSKVANHYREIGFQYVDSLTFGRMIPHAHLHLIPHNGDQQDWQDSLKKIGEMQNDPSRRFTTEEGERIANMFKL